MFPDQKEDWLREVSDICTTTLELLNEDGFLESLQPKIEFLGE